MVGVSALREIANWQDGLISPAVDFDEERYRQEAERVRTRPGTAPTPFAPS
jgi:hypothetical protein